MPLPGGTADARPGMFGELPGQVGYLKGSDPALWRTRTSTFQRVGYQDVYPGVDLVYYGTQHHLEYDFVVHPGGDPESIAFAFDGSSGLELEDRGDIFVRVPDGLVRHQKPHVYQEVNGVQEAVDGRYRLLSPNRVRFEIGAYDRTRPGVTTSVGRSHTIHVDAGTPQQQTRAA